MDKVRKRIKVRKRKQHVNDIVLKSIPMDKELKRYFLRKFNTMVDSNGQAYACDKFKTLRETLMGYRADPKRFVHAEAWLHRSGMKVNGWLRKLFHYVDTQPENAFQFVKLYCGPNEPIVSVGSAAEAQHRVLAEAQNVNATTPEFLRKWLHHVCRERKLTVEQYALLRTNPSRISDWMRNYVVNHDYVEYEAYIRRWKSLLWVEPIDSDELRRRMAQWAPTAEMYVDYQGLPGVVSQQGSSESLASDYRNLVAMADYLNVSHEWGGNGLTTADYRYLMSILDADAVWSTAEPQSGGSLLDGTYVGQIHHIPKKGTVKRRSVAPPNRFIQWGMVPVDLQLEMLLKRLERARDCTYNQTRLNTWLINRVSNDTLYAGSVDLHQATDFLPFEWMQTIWSEVLDGRVGAMVGSSWTLFCHASRGAWLNQGYRDRWTTGQPLGALPSFKCLGLTHNLLVEALCFTLGLGHSPYAILGDDIVITNRKVRRAYIRLMTNAGVPLSLNKSYEGRLVEFAGQLFIKGLAPFYNTDQRALTWNSLFDYQWATGVVIPFSNLPRQLQKRVEREVAKVGLSGGCAGETYHLALLYGMPARGSHVPWTGLGRYLDLIPALAMQLDEAERNGALALDTFSGTVILPGGHPVTFASRQWAEKDGHFLRYRRPEPQWFRSKYRPVATDKLIAAAASAIAESNGNKVLPTA